MNPPFVGTASSAVWGRSKASSTALLVLLALAWITEAYDIQTVEISQSELARMTRLNPRTIGRAVKELTGLGELEIVRAGFGLHTAVYRVVV